MVTVKVVDLRHERGEDALRVNVSRRRHSNDDLHLVALGNPFIARTPGDTAERYTAHLEELGSVMDDLQFEAEASLCSTIELGCWCGGASTCHANIIAAELRKRL